MAERSVATRVKVLDADKAAAELRAFGQRGERALKRIESTSGPASAGLGRVGTAGRAAEGALSGVAARAGPAGIALSRLGPAGIAAAAAIGAVTLGFRATTSAAADFEQGLIGVGKTTDLEGQALARLGDRIGGLSVALATGTDELLATAQAAGQLGVQGADNIALFTETVTKLGSASDLAGAQAATVLARMLTVTGEAVSEVDTLASVIVRLGNNFAATESEIAEAATRVAQAGARFGVSSAEAAAFGAAIKQLGLQSEAAGTQMSQLFEKLAAAVGPAADNLEAFTALTGQSGDALRAAFDANAVDAVTAVIAALGRLPAKEQGAALASLGLEGVRAATVLGTLAARADVLKDALAQARDETTRNAEALETEFARAMDSTNKRLEAAGNAAAELARKLGEKLLPAVNLVAEGFTNLFRAAVGALESDFDDPLAARVDKVGNLVGRIAALQGELARGGNPPEREETIRRTVAALEGQLEIELKLFDIENRRAEAQADAAAEPPKAETPAAAAAAGGLSPEERKKILEAQEKEAAAAIADLDRLIEENEKKRLGAIDRLALARDRELERYRSLLARGLIETEDFDDARLALEEDFQREKAKIEKEAADKARAEADKARAAAEKLAREEAEALARPFARAAEGIQDSFADAFRDVFDGGEDIFERLGDRVLDIFKDTAAEIATLRIILPVVAPAALGIGGALGLDRAGLEGLSRQLGLTAAQTQELLGGGGGSGVTGSLAGVGSGLIGGFQSQAIGSFLANTALEAGASTATAAFLGNAGLNLGFGAIGGLGASLLGLGSGDPVIDTLLGGGGAFLGGGIGAGLGTILGLPGGPVGAAIGGFLGTALGGLFGGSSRTPRSAARIGREGGEFVLIDISGQGGGFEGTAVQILEAATGALQIIADELDATIREGFIGGVGLRGEGDPAIRVSAIEALGGAGAGLLGASGRQIRGIPGIEIIDPGDFASFEEAAAAAVDTLLSEILKQGVIEGLSEDLATAIARSASARGDDIQAILADIEFAARILDETLFNEEDLTEAEKVLREINTQFEAAIERARLLGLEEARVIELRDEAIAGLVSGFEEGIERGILAFTDPAAAALAELADAQERRLKEAEALGADLVEVERLNTLERARVIERFAGQAASSLARFLDELTFGGLSGAAPGATLEGTRARFEAVAEAALGGDIAARGRIEEAARDFLEASREFNASAPDFFADLERTREVVETLIGADPNQAVVDAVTGGFDTQAALTAELIDEVAAVRRELEALRASVREGSALDAEAAMAA